MSFFLAFLFLITFTSCASDTHGKEKLVSNLHSSFMATADFIISDGQNNIVGKADVVKDEKISLSITEPEGYSGINIISDNAGKSDVISFEFSGIPAEVPKSSASGLSLILSLFSDDMPTKISNLGKDAFSSVSDKNGYYEVFFTQNGTSYKITYDKTNGHPHMFDAGNDEMSVNIVLTDFNITDKK